MQCPPPFDSYWAAKPSGRPGGAMTFIFSASNSVLAGPDSVSIVILRLLERYGLNRRNFRRPQMPRARVVTIPYHLCDRNT
jgi:hypothetical protein